MKVLFFVSEYNRFNGGQRSLKQLLLGLPAEGIQPLVIFPAKGLCYDAFSKSGIPCKVLPAPSALLKFGQHLLQIPLLVKLYYFIFFIAPYSFKIWILMQRQGISILHCNTSRSLLLGALIPKIFGKKIIWHVRGELHALSKPMKMFCAKLAHSIWLVAARLMKEIDAKYHVKCFVIYNGIDDNSFDFSERNKTTTSPQDEIFICTFAAITPFKGHHHLIDAIDIVNKQWRGEPLKFIAVGQLFNREYVALLEEKIKKLDIENFEFAGWIDNPLEYYEKAHIVVLPTVEKEILTLGDKEITVMTGEGLPRTVLEAMYLGKLIIATDVAGAAEQIIDRESGFLVKPSNPQELAATLLHVLSLPEQDKAKVREAAYSRVKEVFDAGKLTQLAAKRLRQLS